MYMKINFKKFSLFFISFIFILSSLSIKAFSSELNSKLITYQKPMQNDLIKFIESSENSNLDKLELEEFVKNNIYKKYNLNYEDFKQISKESNKQIQKLKNLNYSNQQIADNQIIKTIKTKNNYLIEFYNNGCFSIENLNSSINPKLQSNGAVWGQAYKDYYSWTGIHIFSVAVCSSFGYDGKKAYYNGNFDAYYERGFLSVWQVSNWNKWREPVGSNYRINASGNFHYGFEIDGVGIVIQDLYIKQSVTCDKYGNITKYFNQ